MIDFAQLDTYRENNRIEAKKALGGLPKSIWETYSAFANTLGGIILLGVVEGKDKSLHTVDLPDPDALIAEFWQIVNDPQRTSVNVLSARDMFVQEVGGDRIIVIQVPRAGRRVKPVYVDGNPLCAYRRSGEGDYKCTPEEYEAMVRDAAVETQDMRVLNELDMGVFQWESVRGYRRRMRLSRPEHAWETLEDEAFLRKLGAAGVGEDGRTHPTAAGLLMFGGEREIVRAYPAYRLEYREEGGARIVSSSRDWSGNVYDFYFRVCDRLERTCDARFAGNADVRGALCEALANCLMNADYCGAQGIEILNRGNGIIMTNPGSFRIEVGMAKSGGVSDARNGAMQAMFHLIDVGARAGSGLPNIYRVWRGHGWAEPVIREASQPDRIVLTLAFAKRGENEAADGEPRRALAARMKETIIAYLTDHARASADEIAAYLGVGEEQTGACMAELVKDGIVVSDGEKGERAYRLRA